MQRSTENITSNQFLKGTGTRHEATVQKTSRHGSRSSSGVRRKNGVNIIDDFLQKAIDARDIELLTASITVAKDIITNDGPENGPNHASPSRISPRQRQLLSGDVEAMNLIVRAEGYLSLLKEQKHEAITAVCRRKMSGGIGVSRDENENDNDQQVDAFIDSFYSTFQSSLTHTTDGSVNASQDSRDGMSDALPTVAVHPIVTPTAVATAGSSSSSNTTTRIPSQLAASTMTPSSAATTTVPVPTPSSAASLEVSKRNSIPTVS